MCLDGHPTGGRTRPRMLKQQPANCWILTENLLFSLLSLPHRRKPRRGAGYLDHRSAANSATMPPTSAQATVPTCSPTRVGLLGGWVPNRPERKKKNIIFGPSAAYTPARCRCYRSVRALLFAWVAPVIHTWMCSQRGPAHGGLYSGSNPPTAAFGPKY